MWSVGRKELWRYCTREHCRDMLLSFQLLGENGWPEDKEIACLYALANHSERHYEKIRIPKKRGGVRTLLAPDPLLKYVQRNLLNHVLEGRPAADCAAAYRKRDENSTALCGIVENAAVHAGQPLLMKLDIQDFFGNITFPMVLHHAFPARYFPPVVGNLLTALCCYGEYLPQGAPTSPAVSNLVMRPFDEFMQKWCSEQGVSYSRYCDDMTFSGDFDPKKVRKKAEGFLQAMGFELNHKKTRVISKAARQTVTGLVVNDKAQTSVQFRKSLRQEIYYCRKFGVEDHLKYRQNKEELTKGEAVHYLQQLLGRVNYVCLTRPEDPWFLEAKKWLKAILVVYLLEIR